MFDHELPVAVLDAMRPSPHVPEPWETCADESWLDQLIAADPERPRDPREMIAAAETLPVTAQTLVDLADIDLDELDDNARIGYAVAAARVENHAAALKLTAVAAFAGPAPTHDTDEAAFAWTEVSAALRLGEGAARRLVDTARHLASHLTGTLAAMRTGDLTERKAQTLAERTAALNRHQCAAVEARVLTHAARRSPQQHTDAVRRAVDAVDPDRMRERRDQARQDSALIREHHGDGVADVLLRNLDAVDADTLCTAADTWARRAKAAGDPRTLDQLRAAAPVDWARRFLTSDPVPTRHGMPAVVNITIDLPTALGLTDAPGEVLGSGALIPADAVRDLLQHCKVRFLLTDPTTGQLRDISTRLHDPSPLMNLYRTLRDVTATTPSGPGAVAAAQDGDHIDPRGPTSPGNLHSPTRGWHRAKTFRHWTITTNPNGSWTWTSRRTGRTYTVHPHDYRHGP